MANFFSKKCSQNYPNLHLNPIPSFRLSYVKLILSPVIRNRKLPFQHKFERTCSVWFCCTLSGNEDFSISFSIKLKFVLLGPCTTNNDCEEGEACIAQKCRIKGRCFGICSFGRLIKSIDSWNGRFFYAKKIIAKSIL